jgi:hypothetical protein
MIVPGKNEVVTVTAETLGLLAFCAASYDRRTRGGVNPDVWEKLSQEWRDKINADDDRDPRWERKAPRT